jgi:putative SOS response-associated peptidase YedK
MCFTIQLKTTAKKAETRFKAKVDNPLQFLESDAMSGFAHLKTPIILDKTPEIISTNYSWGLIPAWAKEESIRKNTLNARIETVTEKPSFRNNVNNRCLIIATAFYEWHWNDPKGKSKDKYQINSQEEEIFAFAGLYSNWTQPETGETIFTYTMLTTEANELMQYIHNTKKRMPIVLNRKEENAWLDPSNAIQDFASLYQANLVGFPISKSHTNNELLF